MNNKDKNNKHNYIQNNYSYMKISFLLFNFNILRTGHPRKFIFVKCFKTGHLRKFVFAKCNNIAVWREGESYCERQLWTTKIVLTKCFKLEYRVGLLR